MLDTDTTWSQRIIESYEKTSILLTEGEQILMILGLEYFVDGKDQGIFKRLIIQDIFEEILLQSQNLSLL